jgi:hypothetical protein
VAKTINVTLKGEQAVFSFKPIDRTALYGRRRRVAFDTEGNECSRASLLSDGSLLLQSGMTAQGYFLGDGTWIPQSELTAQTKDGKVELKEISATEALSISFSNTYSLEAEEISSKIKEALDLGKIFSFDFNVKDDYNLETGVLVANDAGIFALIGDKVAHQFSKLENIATVIDESTDNSSDDLDFEMF